MSSNIVLVGMMGSGKTTVGRLIAERTGMEFIDLDQIIVDREGRSITEIFEAGGEEAFRQKETEALREIQSATHAIIATGGGAVTRAENRRLIKQLGTVFWLDAPANELLERIGDDESRPMLRGGEALRRLEQLMAERREQYADASDIHLDTTEFSPDELADRVQQQVGTRTLPEEDVFNTIIAIDGPVGSGKSALARRVARRLNYVHVDTGAMYRCVTLEAMRRNIALNDADALTVVAHSVDVRFRELTLEQDTQSGSGDYSGQYQQVLLNGEDVTEAIRSPEVSRNTSPVADVPMVRAEMVRLQRELALRGRSVLEGRDISTVVVPEAVWKFYVVASLDERCQRRLQQYEVNGKPVDSETLRHDIITRDNRDRNRAQGALRLAPEAIILDSTGMTLPEVVEIVAHLVENSRTTVMR